MRTYKLTVAYDGTNYLGWQRQTNTERTIQGILEQTLLTCTGMRIRVDGSGRTDAGVHAAGQTASLVLPGKVPEEFFTDRINGMLPADIRILEAQLVKKGFHARKSALAKRYEYHIDTAGKPDVFMRRYACHFPGHLDFEKMRKAAGYLTGTHDFTGFTDKKEDKGARRTIYDISIEHRDGKVTISYDGNGFLYHMVRILTGTLLETGTAKRDPLSVCCALESKDRRKAGFLAPAKGLFLCEVRYDQDRLKRRR